MVSSLYWFYWFVLLMLWAVMGGQVVELGTQHLEVPPAVELVMLLDFPQCELCFAGESEGRGKLFCSHFAGSLSE